MSTWGGGGWGDWHTSNVIAGDCPQGDGRHTVDEAVALNRAASVKRREGLQIAHERWLRDGR